MINHRNQFWSSAIIKSRNDYGATICDISRLRGGGQKQAAVRLFKYCAHIFFEKGVNFLDHGAFVLFTGTYRLFRGATPQPY